ncbi:uncharacterized protein [Watersipora subatra]|uniref:uncharacterized protein n=1 Tax=Watersipora subatra TaxID=2589382 RepID=UPI00355C55A9
MRYRTQSYTGKDKMDIILQLGRWTQTQEAWLKRGLLEDDRQWHNTLREASISDSLSRLHNLFAVILISCNPSNPKQLWLDQRESMSEDHQWLKERVILAPKNDTVDHINQLLLENIPGITTSFFSIDCVVEENGSVNYPTEFLNSLPPASMPPQNLQLRFGSPVMLL